MSYHRRGEQGNVPTRSNRFYSSLGAWYFNTREGSPMEPFDDEAEAKQGLNNFLEFMHLAKPAVVSKLHHNLSH